MGRQERPLWQIDRKRRGDVQYNKSRWERGVAGYSSTRRHLPLPQVRRHCKPQTTWYSLKKSNSPAATHPSHTNAATFPQGAPASYGPADTSSPLPDPITNRNRVRRREERTSAHRQTHDVQHSSRQKRKDTWRRMEEEAVEHLEATGGSTGTLAR